MFIAVGVYQKCGTLRQSRPILMGGSSALFYFLEICANRCSGYLNQNQAVYIERI